MTPRDDQQHSQTHAAPDRFALRGRTASRVDRATGPVLLATTGAVMLAEWGVGSRDGPAVLLLVALTVALLAVRVRMSRKAFVAVALVLTVALALRDPGWLDVVRAGLASAGFIAAFFIALSTLRSAAERAEAIRAGGTFLARQPPGRRYLALTVGGQLFALLLNYGSIALLGSLATASAGSEPDPEIRRHRTRRMLLAIQRGFLSTLPWSPLSLSIAVSVALFEGVDWHAVAVPGIVTSITLAGVGWALDTIFKPRLGRRPAPEKAPGDWRLLAPLLGLLGLLFCMVLSLSLVTDVRVVGIVIAVVPAIALAWVLLQGRTAPEGRGAAQHLRQYVTEDLPAYRGELSLLMMAGYIGTVGAPLLKPLIESTGFDAAALPTPVVLVAFIWLIPLAGQIGMNPILAVTLMAPLVPSAEALGVKPAALVVAITSGWAMSGATSPFTATTLLIGSFAGTSARHVGLRWNGLYWIVCGTALSLWVLILAYLV